MNPACDHLYDVECPHLHFVPHLRPSGEYSLRCSRCGVDVTEDAPQVVIPLVR